VVSDVTNPQNPDTVEPDQTPNLIYYEVLTGELDTGMQLLIQLFRLPNGTIQLGQFSLRSSRWDTWGPPTRLEHKGVHPTVRVAP